MIYYCIHCEKEVKKKEEDFLLHCPACENHETLFRLDENDTEILKGKTIKKVYNNEWKDISRLVLFEDGTHLLVELPYSDEIDFHLLEHEYDDDDDDWEE